MKTMLNVSIHKCSTVQIVLEKLTESKLLVKVQHVETLTLFISCFVVAAETIVATAGDGIKNKDACKYSQMFESVIHNEKIRNNLHL